MRLKPAKDRIAFAFITGRRQAELDTAVEEIGKTLPTYALLQFLLLFR